MTIETEVLRGAVLMRGHDIESDAAMCQLIQRGSEPGSEVRRPEGGRDGRDDAKPLGHVTEQRYQWQRVALRHRKRIAQIPFRRTLERVSDERAVFQDQAIKTGAFQRACEIHVEVRLHPV